MILVRFLIYKNIILYYYLKMNPTISGSLDPKQNTIDDIINSIYNT